MVRVRVSKCNTAPVPQHTPGQKHTVLPIPLSFPKLLMSMAFHPQTDGATEWANQSIGQVLQAIVHNDQKNWRQQCPLAEFALNSNISLTMGYALFELNCGFMPQLGQRLSMNTKFAGVWQFVQQV